MKGKLLNRIRLLIIFFAIVLILSGITAFPVYTELKYIHNEQLLSGVPILHNWLERVWKGVDETTHKHAFLFYGFDWLAFAHLVIALLFMGPYRDPVRNKWIIQWAVIACISIIPLAVIAGPIRGIPGVHILIDCAFGILGFIPLLLCLKWINRLQVIT